MGRRRGPGWPARRHSRARFDSFREHQAWRWAAAAAIVIAAVVMMVSQADIRLAEARVSAGVIDVTRVAQAQSIGNSVVFPLRNAFVGFTITLGCTAALLVIPFFMLTSGLIVARRTSIHRGVATLGILVVALFVVNQARLLVIALSMRIWGFQRGFEISHVLLGTVVSTLGVLGGLLLYLWALLRSRTEVTAAHG